MREIEALKTEKILEEGEQFLQEFRTINLSEYLSQEVERILRSKSFPKGSLSVDDLNEALKNGEIFIPMARGSHTRNWQEDKLPRRFFLIIKKFDWEKVYGQPREEELFTVLIYYFYSNKVEITNCVKGKGGLFSQKRDLYGEDIKRIDEVAILYEKELREILSNVSLS